MIIGLRSTRPLAPSLAVALSVGLAVAAIAMLATSTARTTGASAAHPSTPARPLVASSPRQPLAGDLAVGGTVVIRNGRPTDVIGVNAYSATTDYSINWGCGAPIYNLQQMFDQVPVGGLVRVWAFQALGWNNKATPQHLDFTAIDRVVAAATLAHRELILTLSDQAGTCDDGHWHDKAWYDGGWEAPRSDDDGHGLGNLSYGQWVSDVVTRYRSSPAVAMWEPVNEPQASDCTGATGDGCYNAANLSCPAGAALSLQHFFTAVGTLIRGIDPHHLISEGMSGGGQCGTAAGDYAVIGSSPGIDVLTYHDYGSETVALPAGLADRLQEARSIGKPLLVEEAGLSAGTGCATKIQRAGEVLAKAHAALAAGAAGWMPWWYDESGPASCAQDYGPGDPALVALRTAMPATSD